MRFRLGLVEHVVRLAEFDELAEIHERGVIGDAHRLLHIVGDDRDGVAAGQFVDQLLDLRRRDRIERRTRFVEQNDLRLHRDAARDAEALLLSAGQAETARVKLVLHLVPKSGAAQRAFDARVHVGARQFLV